MQPKKSIIFIVCLVFIVSFSFKIWNLKENVNFIDGDEIGYIQAATDLFHIFDKFDINNISFRLFRAFVFPEGPIYILSNFFWISILTILNVPLTEFSLSLFHVIIGSLVTIAIFLIGKEFDDVCAGLIASLLFIIMPLSGFYRSASGNSQLASLLLLLTLLFFMKWRKGVCTIWLPSLFLGLYLASDNQFPGIFPVIAVIIAYYSDYPTLILKIKKTIKTMLNWRVWILPLIIQYPILVTWAYFGRKGDWTTALTGHFLTQGIKIGDIGFQYSTVEGIILSTGLVFAFYLAIAFFFGFVQWIQGKKQGILFFWALVYLIPWFFLLSLGSGYRLHFLQGLIPLIILAAILLLWLIRKSVITKIVGVGIFSIIFIFTLSSTLDYVYNIKTNLTPLIPKGILSDECGDIFALRGVPILDSSRYCYLGSDYGKNWGAKTAGYFIRTNTKPSEAIFTEIGVATAKHYFGNPVFSNKYLWKYAGTEINTKYSYLKENFDDISIIAVRAANYPLIKEYINTSFYHVTTVYSANEPVMLVFYKNKLPFRRLDSEFYDPLFDREYGNWRSQYLEDRLPYAGIDVNHSIEHHLKESLNNKIKAPPW